MEIVRDLTKILPTGFRAAPKVHLGSPFEVDAIDAIESDEPIEVGTGGTAYVPTFSVEAEVTDQDEYEVRIYDVERGRQLVAAIEIISPSNKDRPESRELFIGKMVGLLQQGVCVSLVDLVTVRRANLYADLLTVLGHIDPKLAPTPPPLYAVTLRHRKPPRGRMRIDAWFYPMSIGAPLPSLPIWLTPDARIQLPLEPSYQETCRILGIT